MNWGRVKTVLIILFLCTDILLLATYLKSNYSASVISGVVIESTVDVLKNNGITVDSSVIPKKMPRILHIEAENVISDHETFANALLGADLSQIESGYANSRGKLTFFGDRFNFIKNPSVDAVTDVIPITDEKIAKEVSVSALQNLGFHLKNAKIQALGSNDNYTVTFDNYSGGLPIFNSRVVVELSKSGISSISGIWFNETLSQSGNNNVKSITSALVDFIPQADSETQITTISPGYSILDKGSYHKSATLIPVWHVHCKNGDDYFLDARNM